MANDVSAPLPEVELAPNSVLVITLSDAAAKITAVSVHGFQDATDTTPAGPSPVTGAYTTA